MSSEFIFGEGMQDLEHARTGPFVGLNRMCNPIRRTGMVQVFEGIHHSRFTLCSFSLWEIKGHRFDILFGQRKILKHGGVNTKSLI